MGATKGVWLARNFVWWSRGEGEGKEHIIKYRIKYRIECKIGCRTEHSIEHRIEYRIEFDRRVSTEEVECLCSGQA